MNRILTCALAALLATPAAFAADHGHDHGPVAALGEATVGAAKLTAKIGGVVKPGAEVHLELILAPAAPAPAAVRAWIGTENARGSVKAKAGGDAAKGVYDAHIDVPAPLPADSKLWVAVEASDGTVLKASFALPAGAPAGGHGHRH